MNNDSSLIIFGRAKKVEIQNCDHKADIMVLDCEKSLRVHECQLESDA